MRTVRVARLGPARNFLCHRPSARPTESTVTLFRAEAPFFFRRPHSSPYQLTSCGSQELPDDRSTSESGYGNLAVLSESPLRGNLQPDRHRWRGSPGASAVAEASGAAEAEPPAGEDDAALAEAIARSLEPGPEEQAVAEAIARSQLDEDTRRALGHPDDVGYQAAEAARRVVEADEAEAISLALYLSERDANSVASHKSAAIHETALQHALERSRSAETEQAESSPTLAEEEAAAMKRAMELSIQVRPERTILSLKFRIGNSSSVFCRLV